MGAGRQAFADLRRADAAEGVDGNARCRGGFAEGLQADRVGFFPARGKHRAVDHGGGAGPPGAAKPDLSIEYRFHRATVTGEQLFTWTEPEQYDARTMPADFDMTRGHRVVAARAMPLESFPVGSYRLEVRVTDDTSGASATRDVVFFVQPAAP